MSEKTSGQLDPAALADEVRDLAQDAHRVLNSPTTEDVAIEDLSRRIDLLKDQIRGYPFNELSSWLDNVRQIIDAC
jgi:hypothetical protein